MENTNPNEKSMPAKRRRCTLRSEGHGELGAVPDFSGHPALWVHGTLEPLSLERVDDVPGAQPLRFVPNLSRPHTVEDPIGIPVELFHHASVEIRRRVALGLTPIWYPMACVLVVGHRRFDMSLIPVPQCATTPTEPPSIRERRERSRELLAELRLELYRESFSEWMRHRDISRLDAPPLRIFDALMHAWAVPEHAITHDHLEFRDALLTALALLVDVHKRPDPEC